MNNTHPRLVKNNFDLLRFLFATVVFFVHAYALSGFEELSIITIFLSSEIAVKAFFVISGFLIFMSYERSSSLLSYTKKRIRRIYPAYFTVIMLCALGLIAISSKDVNNYFSLTWLHYTIANLGFLNFLQHSLPGVFEDHNYAAVNGALWTIKIEVMFYFSVPIFVFLFRRYGHLPVIIFFYTLSTLYVFLCHQMQVTTGSGIYEVLARQLPGQLSYFLGGAFCYYFLQSFEKNIGTFVGFAIIALIANHFYSLPTIMPFALAIIVIFFALYLYLGNFGKYGDFSYGIYILHFPIIQILIHSDLFNGKPYLFITVAAITIFLASIAMWHIIEKKFLSIRSHYISVTENKIS